MVRRANLALLVLNLLAVYVLWGSTAPAIRVAVMTMPPWYMAGLRFLIAGALLWGFLRMRGVPMPTRPEWRGATIVGVTLLVLGNGVFSWTLQYLPSHIGALFIALAPLFMASFAYLLEGERLSALGAVGLFTGVAGMVYLAAPVLSGGLPMFATFTAIFTAVAWGLGSILQRRLGGRDLLQGSAMQMLVAGAVLIGVGVLSGEHMTAAAMTPHALMAVGYLIGFGSIVGYSCFLWLMRNVPTTLASTYAYVNPVVAVGISAWLLREHVTTHTLAAAGVIVGGVALMMLAPKPRVAQRTLRAA